MENNKLIENRQFNWVCYYNNLKKIDETIKNIPNKNFINEFYSYLDKDSASADNIKVEKLGLHLTWDDYGVYPFGFVNGTLYIGDEGTKHDNVALKALYDDVNERILSDGYEANFEGYFKDTYNGYSYYEFLEHPDDIEYREEHEDEDGYEHYFDKDNYLIGDWIEYEPTDDEYNDILQIMDISGRYWVYDKVIAFWSIMSPSEMKECIDILTKASNIDFSDYTYVYEDEDTDEIKYCTVSEFINSGLDIEFKPDNRENKGIHLMNQQDKRDALTDFRQNRSEVQGRKLGKIPMTQYHNMIYQESIDNGIVEKNSFKSWFGNSVLIDSEGNPIKMYHGTKNKFDEFSKDFIGSTGSYEGYGFNFTPFEGRASSYSNENVIEAYLRAENPMTSKTYKIKPSKLAKIIAELDKGKPYTDTIVAAYEPSRYNEKWDEVYYRRALPVAAKMIYQYNKENDYGDAGLYAEICLNGNGDKYQVIDLFERLGYDSVIFYDNDDRINTVIVFEPNQIKLVSNKTFNNDSNLMGENKSKKIYINESQLSLITESQASKSISAAKKLVMQQLGYDEEYSHIFIKEEVINKVPELKTNNGSKFVLGVTRMHLNGELDYEGVKSDLNSTIKMVASDAHINEYDRNLNGMSANDLINRFASAVSNNLKAEKEEINQMVFDTPSDYEIVRIDSFEQATEYSGYTQWCITNSDYMFNNITSNGINQFYFCLKNGFENVKQIEGEGCPLDEYGLSMIAVSVNENGVLHTCTCRWNHTNGGNDAIMTAREISQVIGMNFFEIFKPNTKWKDLVSDAMARLKNGEDPHSIFNEIYYSDMYSTISLNGKFNYLNNTTHELLSPKMWFDYCDEFEDNVGIIKVKGKGWNIIKQNGELLSPNQWFEFCSYSLLDNYYRIELKDKGWNFINQNGELLSPNQWFEDCGAFHNGFAVIKISNKGFNFINSNCELLSPNQWFDDCKSFNWGYAIIKLNNKWNFINKNGEILFPNQWFDECKSFRDGLAQIYIENKGWNYIKSNGKLLSPNQWFDDCKSFRGSFSTVSINGVLYKINKNGDILDYN